MISGKTKVLGIIGDPIEHSVSPAMQNAALKELGLDYVYVPFKAPRNSLSKALHGIKSLGLEGANVTIPHKSSVIEYLDELEPTANKIGAVNTIKREEEQLKGFNTDGLGALRALKEKVDGIEDKKVLLLGAGGAARAIAFTLAEIVNDLTISNRTASKAKKLASEIKEKTGMKINHIPLKEKDLGKSIKKSEILINSTSVGMHPNKEETLVTSEIMHSDLTVMDIVYNPMKTRLLREAEKIGANTINGLGMLVQQGAASLEIWTNEKPPIQVMKKAARKALEGL